jgi:hypothetical protein
VAQASDVYTQARSSLLGVKNKDGSSSAKVAG